MSFDDVPGRARREIVDSFDARAAGYANNQWHRRCAERLVGLCRLGQGLRVLDAATGTGFAALAASTAVGPEGHVVGIDLSPGMLREARAAVARAKLTNVELVEGDVVVCSSSETTARFVRFGGRRYHQILKSKFGLTDR